MPKAKEIIIGLAAIGLIATATACGTGTSDGNNAAQNEVSETDSANTENTDNNETAEKDDVLTLGSTFEFDNLEITLGTEIGWTTVDNQFSDQNGADVFYIPITVKNLSDETHSLNMFAITQFGSKGTQLDSVSSFFMDDDIEWAGDLRSGATQESKMHILYDGDGDYFIEFGHVGTDIEVKIPITK